MVGGVRAALDRRLAARGEAERRHDRPILRGPLPRTASSASPELAPKPQSLGISSSRAAPVRRRERGRGDQRQRETWRGVQAMLRRPVRKHQGAGPRVLTAAPPRLMVLHHALSRSRASDLHGTTNAPAPPLVAVVRPITVALTLLVSVPCSGTSAARQAAPQRLPPTTRAVPSTPALSVVVVVASASPIGAVPFQKALAPVAHEALAINHSPAPRKLPWHVVPALSKPGVSPVIYGWISPCASSLPLFCLESDSGFVGIPASFIHQILHHTG